MIAKQFEKEWEELNSSSRMWGTHEQEAILMSNFRSRFLTALATEYLYGMEITADIILKTCWDKAYYKGLEAVEQCFQAYCTIAVSAIDEFRRYYL